MLIGVECEAQITLDTIIPKRQIGIGYDFKIVQISKHESKYYFGDTVTNTFSLYNMDFTPFILNIAVPEPFDLNHGLYQVLYISRTLFDCDSTNIEYAYYSPQSITKSFYIMRTDGTQLFKKDSVTGPYLIGAALGLTDYIRPIVNTSEGTKLFLMNKVFYIYSLCGTLPTENINFYDYDNGFVKTFPNPSSEIINFEINLPDNFSEYELAILDCNAKQLFKEKIIPQKTNYLFDFQNFNSGIYYYSLYSKNKIVQTGKIIINKN